MKFRAKPIIIEAFRYNVDPRPDWFMDKVSAGVVITYENVCLITTPEGQLRAEKGDWVIQGVMGKVYPCKFNVFEATYERVNNHQ